MGHCPLNCHGLKRLLMIAPVEKEHSHHEFLPLEGMYRSDGNQAIVMRIRKAAKENSINYAENRRRCPNSHGEGSNDGNRENRIAPEPSQRITKVLRRAVEPHPDQYFTSVLHGLSHVPKFADAPDLHPLHNVDIAGMVKAGTMGTDEFARLEMIARQLARRHVIARRVVAQVFDDAVVAVHERDPREQIGDNHVAITKDIEVAGRISPVEEIDGFALERETLYALVAAVGDVEDGLGTALVEDDAVRALKLPGSGSRSAEGPYVIAFSVVLHYVARSVAVADVDVAGRCDRQIGGTPFELLAVRPGFGVSL